MKYIFCMLCFLLPFSGSSGSRTPKPAAPPADARKMILLRSRCDSILAEADELYKHELAAWITGDIAAERKLSGGGYCSYRRADTVYSIVFRGDSVLLSTAFRGEACCIDTIARPLSAWERRFTAMRNKLVDTVLCGSFPVWTYEGFRLNPTLIKRGERYELFLTTGTFEERVVPFGNDYLFFADSTGRITGWRQLHRGLLAADFRQKKLRRQLDKGRVKAFVHSHLNAEPLITPTDICLMRLYGPLYGVDTLKVLSPVLGVCFVYSVSKNTVDIVAL